MGDSVQVLCSVTNASPFNKMVFVALGVDTPGIIEKWVNERYFVA